MRDHGGRGVVPGAVELLRGVPPVGEEQKKVPGMFEVVTCLPPRGHENHLTRRCDFSRQLVRYGATSKAFWTSRATGFYNTVSLPAFWFDRCVTNPNCNKMQNILRDPFWGRDVLPS